MSWTKDVWAESAKIFEGIKGLPFIKELADGSLDPAKFDRYIAQDEVYLGNYGRQMFLLADMMTDPAQQEMFRLFAQTGLDGEKAMHELLIGRFGIDTEVTSSVVTSTYNNHTQAAIDSGSKEVALAAMLPCMWIYNEVGLYILSIASLEGNPYKEWVLEYGNEEFTEGVNAVLAIADQWAAAVDDDTRAKMTQAFLEAALFEYAFWDYGYCGDGKDYDYMNSLKGWI
ncbi:MAG: TenA family protein [Bacteroidales bacterium]|nr:TenA family protein [Bacteroidales bacterium]